MRTPAEDRPVRWGRGPVTLLGDAAHPMTPNMGQGACTAIEDAVVLARALTDHGVGTSALRCYERLRARRTRWIVRQSRRIGWLAQRRSPVAVALRDALLLGTPERLLDRPQRRVYGYRTPGARPIAAAPLAH
ncbi:MAG: FAD-dependent monooxygenase [Gemmatimonadota bacterium]